MDTAPDVDESILRGIWGQVAMEDLRSRFPQILLEYRDPWITWVLKSWRDYQGWRDSVRPRPPNGLPPFNLERLGPWQKDPGAGHCWLRTVEGGDPTKIEDRRIFVEKTPRVHDPSFGLGPKDFRSWIEGDKGRSDDDGDGLDPNSKRWADAFALALGYVLPEYL